MAAALKLEGKTVGRLTALYRDGSIHGRAAWICRCRCGKTVRVLARSLTSGNSKSCGHCNDHIHHKQLYWVWVSMVQRCYNKNAANYKYYGGKNIEVCSRWREDFLNFLDDMGQRPDDQHSLDRIDVNGNYCKENCRWAHDLIQQNNRTNTKWISD
jgi:hypothetical protein